MRDWIKYVDEPCLDVTQEWIAKDASLDNEVVPIPEDEDDLNYVAIDHEVFHVCDNHKLIKISDTPNGGAGCRTIAGTDGYLSLYYVMLKYAADAQLEVELNTPPNAAYTEVTGSVWAYYGKGFDYDNHADNYRVWLLGPGSYVTPGRVNLYRSVLAVPANFSLIIEANLSKGGVDLLSRTLAFHVPLDRRSSDATIQADGYSLKLRVNWKLPSEDLKNCSSSNSPISCHLAERRKFGAHSTSTMADPDVSLLTSSTMAPPDTRNRRSLQETLKVKRTHNRKIDVADPDKSNRWSLQEEIAKVFNTSLKRTYKLKEDVPISISTCTKEDGGDYLCSSVMHIWPNIKSCHRYEGPKHAGVAVKDYIMASEYKDMMERCVVCGPGFVKFKLCRKWIAKSIHKMLTVGIETWEPKLPVKEAIIIFNSPYYPMEENMDDLRSSLIGETLSRMLNYSGAAVSHVGLGPSIEACT